MSITYVSSFYPVTSTQKPSMTTFKGPLLNEVLTFYLGMWVPPLLSPNPSIFLFYITQLPN